MAYLAIAKLGAITAGVNSRLTAGERAIVVDRADPVLVLAAPGLATTDRDTVEVDAATGADALFGELRVHDAAPPALVPDPDRAVAIIFTSGTTGAPKGALYGERQLSFITKTDVGDTWGTGGRGVTGTSFAHLGFMTKLPGNLQRGGTQLIMSRWSARGALEVIARERLNTVAGVPTQLALMLRDPDFDDFDLDSVALIIAGGGPITPGLAEEARERFGAKLSTRYSCTEAGIGLGTAYDDPDEDAVVSVGRPLPGVELVVLDDDDRPVTRGDVGAVCLRSPAMMSGYWRDPEATAAAFTPDGHVRTGDLGWVDEQGRLRLVGRSKEMYVRGGYNVYPVEVEAVLSQHPAVAVRRGRAALRPGDGRDRRGRRRPHRRRRRAVAQRAAIVRGRRPRGVQAAGGRPARRRAPPHRGREGRSPRARRHDPTHRRGRRCRSARRDDRILRTHGARVHARPGGPARQRAERARP